MPSSDPESSAPGTDDDLAGANAADQAAALANAADQAAALANAADQAAAEAEARAEAARARADELRRKLDAARGRSSEDAADVEPNDTRSAPGILLDTIPTPEPQPPRRFGLGTVAVAVGALASAGLLGGTGYMVWQHEKIATLNQHTAEFSAAARQGVVNLMSMDYNAAKESVQRVLDGSTGEFHENIEGSADELIKAMQSSKVSTTVTVNDSAVESMTDDTAVVLVSATSQKHDAAQPPTADTQPRVWRVVVMVSRDGGQVKVSDIEFV